MFRLVKGFARRDWAEQFLAGELYMNTVGYFWGNGTEQQLDFMEGVGSSFDPQLMGGLPDDMLEHQVFEAQVLPTGFAYCHVLCFSMQVAKRTPQGTQLVRARDLPEFGEWVVAIDDAQEFLRRITRIARLNRRALVFGPVEYWVPAPTTPEGYMRHHAVLKSDKPMPLEVLFPGERPKLTHDTFMKTKAYEGQAEWRVCLCRGEPTTESHVMNVGRLDGIAHLVHMENWAGPGQGETDTLDADAFAALSNPAAWLEPAYDGTATREQLRNELVSLGGDMAYATMAIG